MHVCLDPLALLSIHLWMFIIEQASNSYFRLVLSNRDGYSISYVPFSIKMCSEKKFLCSNSQLLSHSVYLHPKLRTMIFSKIFLDSSSPKKIRKNAEDMFRANKQM